MKKVDTENQHRRSFIAPVSWSITLTSFLSYSSLREKLTTGKACKCCQVTAGGMGMKKS